MPAQRSAEPRPVYYLYFLCCTIVFNSAIEAKLNLRGGEIALGDLPAARLTLRRGSGRSAVMLAKRRPIGAARGQSMEPEKPLHRLLGGTEGVTIDPAFCN